jgi:hypothetical protein
VTGVLAGYAAALVLTLAVEVPGYGVLLRRLGVRTRTAVVAGVGVNLITHPLLWFGVREYQYGSGWYVAAFLVGEAAVCVAEWLLLAGALRRYRLPMGTLAAVSVAVNAASAAAGLLLALLGAAT